MKSFLICLALSTPIAVKAQLKVNQQGRVNIGSTMSNAKLTVSNLDGVNAATALYGYSRGINVTVDNEQADSSGAKVGVYASIDSYSKSNNFGILSLTTTHNESASSCAGVFARGSGRSGYTYGLIGSKPGSGFGAGVFGTTSYGYGSYVDGNYAGYFNGDIKVTGTINGTLVSSSDGRLKENIREFSSNEDAVLDKLDLLTPISYNYVNAGASVGKSEMRSSLSGEGEEIDSLELMMMEEEMSDDGKPNQVLQKTHYGLIAQELQQVYPDLVYENDNGYLSINYTELIPIMLQSIKELKAQVDELRSPSSASAKVMALETGETTGIDAAIANIAGMDQNVPNPFSGETDIAIYLPETVQTATLYIYDLSGKQVEQHAIEGRGNTTMTIHADRMDAGMYIYSLIADGKVVATKRMIVVK